MTQLIFLRARVVALSNTTPTSRSADRNLKLRSIILLSLFLLFIFCCAAVCVQRKHFMGLYGFTTHFATHLMRVKVITHQVPPNRYIFLPITMHDCRRRAFGEIPRVTTRCQTFFTGSKQCRSLK